MILDVIDPGSFNQERISLFWTSRDLVSAIHEVNLLNFRLKLLRDGPGEVDTFEDDLVISNYDENNIREVVLYSDEVPFIYAKSILPLETIRLGLGVLGNLKENPLGDILFSNPEIKKKYMLFAKFESNKKIFYGRKGIYTVKGYPFSVCEIFLINDS